MLGLAIGIAAMGCGIGLGLIGSGAMAGMARQPEAAGMLRTNMLIALAFVELVFLLSLFLLPSNANLAPPAPKVAATGSTSG